MHERLPRLALLFSLCALPVLAACQRQRLPQDELVLLIEQPARNIDPRSTTTSYDFKLSFLCFARLISVDSDTLEPVLDLAESFTEVPPDSPKDSRRRYDVTLRPARFSDGSPVTAADVAYTFDAVLHPRTGNVLLRSRFQDAGLVPPIEVLGERSLRITLSHPHASIRTDLDFGILKRGSIEAGRLVGAGPFVLQGEVGEITRFVRNPYYYGGPPPQARLTVRVVRDANSRLLSLVGGSADLTQNTVSPLLFEAVERWRDRLRLVSGPSAIFFYMGMNNEDPQLKDPRVRRALMHAIDRERIIRTKLRGRAVLATGMLPTMHWAYSDQVERYPYDPARARALLDEAGFPDPDGPGPLPRFALSYKTSTDALPLSIARVIAAQLGDVGVSVEVRPFEFHVFLADVKKGNFQLFTLKTGEVAEPNLYKRFFHSRFIPTAQNPDAGHNRVRYRNPEIDALLDAGEREPDRARRREIYVQVQRILSRDLPVLPMWHEDNVAVMRAQVQGYRPLPSAQLTGLARAYKVGKAGKE
jgi:peptide/nickel transport system substrate-binding protein